MTTVARLASVVVSLVRRARSIRAGASGRARRARPALSVSVAALGLVAGQACTSGRISTAHERRVGPEGATLTFPGEIELVVPPGVLEQSVEVTLSPLDPVATQRALDQSGLHARHLLAAFRAEPDGLAFSTPVTVTLTTATPTHTGLPVHYVLDPDTGTYNIAWTHIELDPASRRVRVSLRSFSDHAVAEVEAGAPESCQGDAACRCRRISAQEDNEEKSATAEDCSVSQVDGSVKYFDCAGLPTERWTLLDISDGCVPRLDVVPGSDAVAPGEQTSVDVSLRLLGEPFVEQPIALAASGPGTVAPTSGATGNDGTLLATFMAGDAEGMARVDATTTVEYATKITAVNSEVLEMPQRTIALATSANIEVTTKPILFIVIEPGERGPFLQPHETVAIYGGVVAGEELIDATVDLSISGPGTLSTNRALFSVSGPAEPPQVTAGDGEGTISITGVTTVEYTDAAHQRRTATITAHATTNVKDLPPEHWQLTFSETVENEAAGLADSFTGTFLASYVVRGTASLTAFDPTCVAWLAAAPLHPQDRDILTTGSNNLCGEGSSTIADYVVTNTDPEDFLLTNTSVTADSPIVFAGSVAWASAPEPHDYFFLAAAPAYPFAECQLDYVWLRDQSSHSEDCTPLRAPMSDLLGFLFEIARVNDTAHLEGQYGSAGGTRLTWTLDLKRGSSGTVDATEVGDARRPAIFEGTGLRETR